jgi:hypothetical protein
VLIAGLCFKCFVWVQRSIKLHVCLDLDVSSVIGVQDGLVLELLDQKD